MSSVLTTSGAIAPRKTLFDTTHAFGSNLLAGGSSALAVASLNGARTAMRTFPGGQSTNTALGIVPRYLLVPAALAGTTRELLTSEAKPDSSAAANTRNI